MNNKLAIYGLVFVIASFFTLGVQTIPIEQEISVDFQGPKDFRLIMPNGFERYFYWENSTQHSDVTFTYTYYYNLDQVKYCGENTLYSNITKAMVGMTDTCTDILKHWDTAANCTDQIVKCNQRAEEYKGEAEIYLDKFYDKRNSSDFYFKEMQDYQSKWETCNSRMASLEATRVEAQNCEKEVKNLSDDKNTWGFGGFALGMGVAWFLWKRKPTGPGPSEQSAAGISSDAPSVRTPSEMPRFSDGPKE